MALSSATLASAIKSKIIADEGTPEDDAILQAFCENIAEAVVDHIQDNAEVTATIPISSIVTVGSSTTQTGPTAPVNISGTVS